jgi:hypothetical protein
VTCVFPNVEPARNEASYSCIISQYVV